MTTQLEQSRRRRSRRVVPTLPAHLESYVNSRTGDAINISCSCGIGQSHTYSEWREATAIRLAARRSPARAVTAAIVADDDAE